MDRERALQIVSAKAEWLRGDPYPLTRSEADRLAAWRAEWLMIAWEERPCDRLRFESAVTALYRDIGEYGPEFVWGFAGCRSAGRLDTRKGHVPLANYMTSSATVRRMATKREKAVPTSKCSLRLGFKRLSH
jgi:hypothetical protein